MNVNTQIDLSTFVPLDAVQVWVIQFCQELTTSFISHFSNNWQIGLSVLKEKIKTTSLRAAKFTSPSLSEGLTEVGSGYSATLSFSMMGTDKGMVSINLTMKARFDTEQCLAVCSFIEDGQLSEVENELVEFTERADVAGARLARSFEAEVFRVVNEKLGLQGDLPQLEPV